MRYWNSSRLKHSPTPHRIGKAITLRSIRSPWTWIARRILLAAGLTAAACDASAQTYSFTGCSGPTATVTVTGQLMQEPVISSPGTVGGMPQNYVTYSWNFAASMSLTGSKINGTGFGVLTITYYNIGFSNATTTFGLGTNLFQSPFELPGSTSTARCGNANYSWDLSHFRCRRFPPGPFRCWARKPMREIGSG